MKRNQLREMFMNCLYQMDIKDDYSLESVKSYIDEVKNTEIVGDLEYLNSNLNQFLTNKDQVDELIEKSLKNWKMERISKIDLAIIRVSVTEILYDNTVPYKVSINEAVNLTKKFSDVASSKFVNGILGNVVKLQEIKN